MGSAAQGGRSGRSGSGEQEARAECEGRQEGAGREVAHGFSITVEEAARGLVVGVDPTTQELVELLALGA